MGISAATTYRMPAQVPEQLSLPGVEQAVADDFLRTELPVLDEARGIVSDRINSLNLAFPRGIVAFVFKRSERREIRKSLHQSDMMKSAISRLICKAEEVAIGSTGLDTYRLTKEFDLNVYQGMPEVFDAAMCRVDNNTDQEA